jgi:hypothetical protein
LLLSALVLVLYGLGLPFALGIHKPGDGLSLFALLSAVLGLVISRRQPGNSVAWLLLGLGAVLAVYEDAANYAVLDYQDEVDLDSVRADLAGAVHRALEPAHITLWLSPDAGHPVSPTDAS